MMRNSTSDMCDDKLWLVTFLYGECETVERQRVEAHLAVCAACRAEIEALSGLRGRLAGWAAPEPAPDFRVVPAAAAMTPRVSPAALGWALAAAAMLLLAIGVGVANVEIRYGPDGLVVRTGGVAADGVDAAGATAEVAASAGDTPWRTDLAALESALREEMAGATPRGSGAVSGGTGESEMLARVHRLIEESERRQQRDLALRFAQLMGESEAQRQADLLRIEQQVGQLEGLSEAEVVQHNEIMDYLVRVAGR